MYASVGDYGRYPQPGTWIRVLTDDSIYHHGVYVENGDVIHARKGQGIVLTSLATFSCGKPIERVKTPLNWMHAAQILQRSQGCLGLPYHLLNFNCEHFASWAWGEQPHSEQLTTAVFVTVGAGLTYWAMTEG